MHKKTFLFKYMSCKATIKLTSKIGKQCPKAQKYMITLIQRWKCTRRLIQTKKRIWEVNQEILHIQEKAYARGKHWRNLKGKDVESYINVTRMILYSYCKCLYKQSNVGKMTCYDFVSHMLSLLLRMYL